MARPPKDLPTKKIKGNGYEYAYFRGREHYLGKAGSSEAKRAWTSLVSRCADNPAAAGLDPTAPLVPDLFEAYLKSSEMPDTRRRDWVKLSLRLLTGDLPDGITLADPDDVPDHTETAAADFSPPMFKSWRRWVYALADEKGRQRYAATSCRAIVSAVVATWKWGVSEGFVSSASLEGLKAAAEVPAGRPRPSKIVNAADPADLERVLAKLGRPWTAIVKLLRLTAARPSELLGMTPSRLHKTGVVDVPGFGRCDLSKVGVWVLIPEKHKNSKKGKPRAVWFTSAAQELLAPYLKELKPEELVFDSRREKVKRLANTRATRGEYVPPSQRNRRKADPDKKPKGLYTSTLVNIALKRACDKAGVGKITSYQLRHLAKREITDRFGTEAARIMLGHSRTDTTDLYGGFSFKIVGDIAADSEAHGSPDKAK